MEIILNGGKPGVGSKNLKAGGAGADRWSVLVTHLIGEKIYINRIKLKIQYKHKNI